MIPLIFISGHRSSDSDIERSYVTSEKPEHNLAADSARLPSLDSLTVSRVIMSKTAGPATPPNWYLLKRFGGGEESRFSTYRPAMHR